MATSDRITGLREQIMANAAIAFPNTIHKNAGQYETNINSIHEVVEVVVAEYEEYLGISSAKRAVLVFRTSVLPTYAAWGEIRDSVESALESLLEELGKILVKNSFGFPDHDQPAGRDISAL